MNAITIAVLATLLSTFDSTGAQDRCITPTRKDGQCINIKNCEELVNILKRARPLPQNLLDFLRDSQCGFEGAVPKVCCPISTPVLTVNTTTAPDPVVTDPPDVSNHPNLRLLNHDKCGPLTQGRIIGGNKTGVFDFPWMALIAYDTGAQNPEFRCGGSLINKRYILTAAHCVTALPEGLVLIGARVGDHDISTERDCDKDEDGLELNCAERYQDFEIDSAHFHPEYSRTKFQNDIALIRLNKDVDLQPKNVKPICLPIGPPMPLPKKVIVTGWGATELGPRSQDLLKVSLTPVSNAECKEAYKKNIQIWYKQLCAGGKKRMDSCLGDSGGPLQAPGLYNNNMRYIQYGIVSFGLRSCGTEGFPGVYTNIKYYMDWILNTMAD